MQEESHSNGSLSQANSDSSQKNDVSSFAIQAPSIALPKGGGAIRGIGEKFAANPVTGTGSMTIPIATSPGRSGFGPQLSLSYDSGSGNGPFGLGWNLSLPTITRKTDKGLPKYQDNLESDEFILSGAEDLVPVLVETRPNKWEREPVDPGILNGATYNILRFRPRIEGLFARIERWSNESDPTDVIWRSISKDNITTWYGKTKESRIVDPKDKSRIFSWLICESYDDKGNAIVYEYAKEDAVGVVATESNEANRTDGDGTDLRTANRYLKRIKYGNKTSRLIQPNLDTQEWFFEVVFDYDESIYNARDPNSDGRVFAEVNTTEAANPSVSLQWQKRQDPFSTYRAGFEIRTYRLCHRVLMVHHFDEELGVENYLVRSTEFGYKQGPVASFITGVTQSGYLHQNDNIYLKKSMPPVEFEYSKATIQQERKTIDPENRENLPQGLDGSLYQWADLDGEGAGGILSEQNGAWFYKRNLSPLPIEDELGNVEQKVKFSPTELINPLPSSSTLANGQHQIMDLAGDGEVDVVTYEDPVPGFFERTPDGNWQPHKTFKSLPNVNWKDPNLKFVDLTGDGHADIFITEDEAFTWYASLAEDGFAPAQRTQQLLDEEKGPRLVLADGTQSIYLSDLSGDGLSDLVRIRNGEVCYWPNLGYCRFGAKVTMDNAPYFDTIDQFDQKRIRLADIDGSGVTDIIYLKHDAVHIYLNHSGNRWADVNKLTHLPPIDNTSNVMVADLMGNGTACLVWSSPLPGNATSPMSYVDLMGGQKPHLLTKTINNLGAETHIHYAPSTKFYLKDKQDGKDWITRLHFPVHVVECVETYDHISHNRFATRYAYHHGYFDGVDREFRGFGMVEQWDTEEYASLSKTGEIPNGDNIAIESHIPPMHTKTWYHTGMYLGRNRVSNFFAGLLNDKDIGEYYPQNRSGDAAADAEVNARLLEDTILPNNWSIEEEREACRALKGQMLRQEVYAEDGTDKQQHPYTVTEQNFTVKRLQAKENNQHAVFFTHAREALNYHYERNPNDPRIQHALTLEVDDYGNVLKSAAIAYGRKPENIPFINPEDISKQARILITYTENEVTNAVNKNKGDPGYESNHHPDNYRSPLPYDIRTYELTNYPFSETNTRYKITDFVEEDPNDPDRLGHIFDQELDYEQTATTGKQRRLIEQVKTLYRDNKLTGSLPEGKLESLAIPFESYKLAYTPDLIDQVYKRKNTDGTYEVLLQDLTNVLGGKGADQGGYVNLDNKWWIPSGHSYFIENPDDTTADELSNAKAHFFLPRCYRDPFGNDSTVTYDGPTDINLPRHDLLVSETRDALDNIVSTINDYRVLQPKLITDPNQNRSAAAFDALGLVVATAVMGKRTELKGDLLDDFDPDPTLNKIQHFIAEPQAQASTLLGKSTTRIVYDLDRYQRCKQPPFAATLARETHYQDENGTPTKIQISFSYSDGFGREIQKKIQAERGLAPERDVPVAVSIGDLQPGEIRRDIFNETIQSKTEHRWVGNGRTIFNNKGKPVKQYEPFFSATHLYEQEREITDTGVTPVLFYDPLQRVIATLHPNHTYEKVLFDSWYQTTYDVNDTVAGDPRTDTDIKDYVEHYFDAKPPSWQTWLQQRNVDANNPPSDSHGIDPETDSAVRSLKHANTPTVAHLDSLGRPFLTVAHNKVACPNHKLDGTEDFFQTRVELDIEGNQREVRDAATKVWDENGDPLTDGNGNEVTDELGRIVMQYDYTMVGPEQNEEGETPNRVYQLSMEAGARWVLNDVLGNPIRNWDSRGHSFITEYDTLRRPVRTRVIGADPNNPSEEFLTQRLVYGEQHPQAAQFNLRGQLYLHLDQAGVVTTDEIDFKGNPLQATRRLAVEYKKVISWSMVNAVLPNDASAPFNAVDLETVLAPLLEVDTYTNTTSYDALNRSLAVTSPDGSIYQPAFNEANLLNSVKVNLKGKTNTAGHPIWTHFVNNIDYDAKGQREKIEYANNTSTFYQYDPLTFRLNNLITAHGTGVNCATVLSDAERSHRTCPKKVKTGICRDLQNLSYTYDPAGNITHIQDDAQQTVYFNNQCIEPSNDYTYDAIYRLIQATGREQLSGIGGSPISNSYNDVGRVGLSHPGDGNAVGRYCEKYVYDEVGNFLEMNHHRSFDNAPAWKRHYSYKETSLIEDGVLGTVRKFSNRLSSTKTGNGNSTSESYTYDAHGNMLKMPHLQKMKWDYKDQLQMTQRQSINTEDQDGIDHEGERTFYVYDASGQRVRKVMLKADGTRKDERIYLGGYEIYIAHAGTTPGLKRETLYIMDDKQRIAMVENRNEVDDKSPERLIRYQFGNHLGSASLELDQSAQIISYEEYAPYGSSSYQAVDKSITEVAKRFRYSGKERDEENGFYYYGARYYVAWLGRWCSTDPLSILDNINMYIHVNSSPINYIDEHGKIAIFAPVVIGGIVLIEGGKLTALGWTLAVGSAAIIGIGTGIALEKTTEVHPEVEDIDITKTAKRPIENVKRVSPSSKNPRSKKMIDVATLPKTSEPDVDPYTEQDKENKPQRHHIASHSRGEFTTKFQEILSGAGMTFESPENIVKVIGHQGPHPEEYHSIVLSRLQAAVTGRVEGTNEYSEAVKNSLVGMGLEISSPFSLLGRLARQRPGHWPSGTEENRLSVREQDTKLDEISSESHRWENEEDLIMRRYCDIGC